MFDTALFAEKAAMIAKEKADAQAKQELEELQAMTTSLANKKRGGDEEEDQDTQANAPDRDAVEKQLIHVGNQADEKIGRPSPTLEVRRFLEAMKSEPVQACQLSEAELRGYIAEAEIDERGEVRYHDHIKTWVPIIFELRKSRIYDGILAKEWGPGEEHLVNLSSYEAQFPLNHSEDDDGRPGSASSSHGRGSKKGLRKGLGSKGQTSSGRPGSARRALSRNSSRSLGRSDSQSSIGSEVSGSRPGSRAPSRAG